MLHTEDFNLESGLTKPGEMGDFFTLEHAVVGKEMLNF
jgi:hypothetical protein